MTARRLGRPEHAATNSALAARLAEVGTLVVAHRGTPAGSVVENTPEAVRAAVASGADAVEIDGVASVDGEYFAFHDGEEPRLLGVGANLRDLTAAQIRRLRYVHVDRPGRPARVSDLTEVLRAVPEHAFVNLDRTWPWWPDLLPRLDPLGMTRRLLLKCHASDERSIAVLRAHQEPYPFTPICLTAAEAVAMTEAPDLNTVAVELIAKDAASEFLDPAVLGELRRRGVAIAVNAEVLTAGVPLFAEHDDERAVLGSPATGWGPLLDLGAGLIQTDWPWLLREYRDTRRSTPVPPAGPGR